MQREHAESPHSEPYLCACNALSSSHLGLSVPAHFLHIEKLVAQFGTEAVFLAFSDALDATPLSDERRMCVLVGLQFVAINVCAERVPQYAEKIQALISPLRTATSIEAFSMEVVAAVDSNRADLAVAALLKNFAWLRTHRVQNCARLNLAAAYACLQFGRFELALQFSYLSYSNACEEEDEHSISLSGFFLLNANRIVTGSSSSLSTLYQHEVSKLEAGRFDLGLHINFMLPVYAAADELAAANPDLPRVERLLGFSAELGGTVDRSCWSEWEATNGCLQLQRGHDVNAIASLERSELSHARTNASMEPLRKSLRNGLGLRAEKQRLLWTVAPENNWRALQHCVDFQFAQTEH